MVTFLGFAFGVFNASISNVGDFAFSSLFEDITSTMSVLLDHLELSVHSVTIAILVILLLYMRREIKLKDEVMKLKYEEMTLIDEGMALKVKEMKLKDEILKLKDKEIALRKCSRYFRPGYTFPPVEAFGHSSTPSTNRKHSKILTISTFAFGIIPVSLIETDSKEDCYFPIRKIEFSNVSVLQGHVKSLLLDMLLASGIDGNVSIVDGNSISSMKSDLLVVFVSGVPIGAVEVKLPNLDKKGILMRGAAFNVYTYGQIFDYMLQLRAFHGVRQVFGIITTLIEWQIVWLPDTQEAALATDLSYGPNIVDSTIPSTRSLHVSKDIYCFDEPRLLCACLTTVLKKMKLSSNDRIVVALNSSKRFYIEVTPKLWQWKTIENDLPLSLMPPTTCPSNLLLLRDYHGGADGRVWLTASLSGRIAVLKILSTAQDYSIADAEKEASAWARCGFTAFASEYMKQPCVVMPFAMHVKVHSGKLVFEEGLDHCTSYENHEVLCDQSDNVKYFKEFVDLVRREERDIPTILQKAVHFLASHNIAHLDIEWRHVALVPIFSRSTNKLVGIQEMLIDLTRVEFTSTFEEAMDIMQPSLDTLLSEND
jgi:hypothetical protein